MVVRCAGASVPPDVALAFTGRVPSWSNGCITSGEGPKRGAQAVPCVSRGSVGATIAIGAETAGCCGLWNIDSAFGPRSPANEADATAVERVDGADGRLASAAVVRRGLRRPPRAHPRTGARGSSTCWAGKQGLAGGRDGPTCGGKVGYGTDSRPGGAWPDVPATDYWRRNADRARLICIQEQMPQVVELRAAQRCAAADGRLASAAVVRSGLRRPPGAHSRTAARS